MMTLYKGKYRVETTRLRTWDYGSDAYYFITICTAGRMNVLGDICDDQIHLSAVGEIARAFWCEVPDHFSYVQLDEFVIMPNHSHGIIAIDHSGDNPVETRHGASLQPPHGHSFIAPSSAVPISEETANRFGPLKPGSLPAVINAYKASVTR